MKKILITTVSLCTSIYFAFGQFASWDNRQLILDNGVVERIIQLPNPYGAFITKSYKPKEGAFYHISTANDDFRFLANNKVYQGSGNWTLIGIEQHSDNNTGRGVSVRLMSDDEKLEVAVQFLLYPQSAFIRKNLVIKNLTNDALRLEAVVVERFNTTNISAVVDSWIFHDYGRRKAIGPYEGNMQDALVIVHDPDRQAGLVIGNEAPGVVKHTAVFWGEPAIDIGLTPVDSRFPFKKVIKPQDKFATPQVFTMLYCGHKDPGVILNTAVPDFVRKHLGARLFEVVYKPTMVYDTWVPFGRNINEKLIMELAKAAADAGMKEFVIDDGWQENYGDWNVDRKKFPHGLKPVFDYIRSLGMKPGLWVSVGSASLESNVFKEHPEWFVVDADGNYTNLHTARRKELVTACFSTGWGKHIRGVLNRLISEYGVEYLKLDFTVVTSPYRYNNHLQSGCYAKNHDGHTDRQESLYTNYANVWDLFDALHRTKPDLFIDCTFETMGGMQLIDYAMLKHAEGNWLSNFMGPAEHVDLRIRNMAWWRSPAIPATALVIGNAEMQDSLAPLHLKSLAGALPVVLGDPRKLSAAEMGEFRAYADWMQRMEEKYEVMAFRQDLPTFNEPQEGFWDGFQRINTDTKSGGIIGVFKHGSKESKRVITIAYLEKEALYRIKDDKGTLMDTKTGYDLENNGLEVRIDGEYDGLLFEIERVMN